MLNTFQLFLPPNSNLSMHKFFFSFVLALLSLSANAQSNFPADSSLFINYKYRCIGPFRGGRASGVCGDYKNKQTFYMGTTGGGVWQTRDGGSNWTPISDKYFGGSIGSVAVCPTDPLLIYVGTGENTLRGNVSEGKGMWKSNDGGKTWQHIGLSDTRHITKIIFHPKNPDVVYCTAIGHLFGENDERGVFKTTDGGKSWKQILFVNENVGAVDMQMDATNPNILYASSWRVKRTPHSMESGGEGSALWKSMDGGDTWKNISHNKGLPKDTIGIIGLALSSIHTDNIYAILEHKEKGGLYFSHDAGTTWEKVNDESKIRQRAWYFSKVYVDPKNDQIVYVCNVEFYKSTDGGKTFQTVGTPHGDHHNLWIDPEDGQRMIIADDGGAQVSFDGGQNWSTYNNQPTAQFYRVSTDNHFPYRVLGCQQDNSSVRILSRTYGSSIGNQDWSWSAGFESGHIVADPLNDEIVYGGNYGGYLSRLNHKTGENRTVSIYPVSPIGEGADALKYRFQWNFPIFFSPHNPKRLYAAGNHLFMTENEGQSWKKISPDLTTNDKSKQKPSGGIITKDNTGVEYYCTIFAATESPIQANLLWCGSDDGLIHVSKNGGDNWTNVTPRNMPNWMMINSIEASPFDAATCYIVGTKYKLDDETPYIYKTTDYGNSWKLITDGIPENIFARCLRADPMRKGVLYCGTEAGMYISFDEGNQWRSLQLNLPTVPITDLAVKNDDLVVATQGRSFWILDDLSTLHHFVKQGMPSKFTLFPIAASYLMRGSQNEKNKQEGLNKKNGTVLNFYLPISWQDTNAVSIKILDENKKLLRTYSSQVKDDKMKVDVGINQWVWNHYIKGVEKIEGAIMWHGNIDDIKVPVGKYFARIISGKDSMESNFELLKDPNYEMSQADYKQQFDFLIQVKNKFKETQQCLRNISSVRNQINTLSEKLASSYPAELDSLGKKIQKSLTSIEESLYQTKAKSGQDVLNYPIKLNDKLVGIFDAANQYTAPNASVKEAYADIAKLIDIELEKFESLRKSDISNYNVLVRKREIDYLLIKKEE